MRHEAEEKRVKLLEEKAHTGITRFLFQKKISSAEHHEKPLSVVVASLTQSTPLIRTEQSSVFSSVES